MSDLYADVRINADVFFRWFFLLFPGHGGTPLQKNFVNPPVTVHVTTGNGGPPSADNFNEDCPGADCGSIPATRKQSVAYGYGRLIAYVWLLCSNGGGGGGGVWVEVAKATFFTFSLFSSFFYILFLS